MPQRRSSPKNCFWRGGTLWGRVKIKGRDHKWSLRTDDPKAARARIEAERKRLIAAVYYGDDRKLFDDVAASWAEHHIAHAVAPTTAARYAVSLGQIRPWVEGKYLDEVDRAMTMAFVDARLAGGVSQATVRRDLTALSSILEHAIERGWRDDGDNPALARLKRLKERRDPIVLPEPAHIERVIQRAPGRLGDMIRAAWVTGCRLNELVGAERGRLDHTRRQLTVRGKGNKVRVIGLDYAGAYEFLRALPVRLGCPFLFWHHDGKPYANASSRFRAIVLAEMQAARKTALAQGHKAPDFRPFRFHDLRHRHAVDWLKSGHSIYDLQQRLGHSSIKVTELYLQFLTPEEKRAAMQGGEHFGEQGKETA